MLIVHELLPIPRKPFFLNIYHYQQLSMKDKEMKIPYFLNWVHSYFSLFFVQAIA